MFMPFFFGGWSLVDDTLNHKFCKLALKFCLYSQIRDATSFGIFTAAQYRIVDISAPITRRGAKVDRIVCRLDGVQM